LFVEKGQIEKNKEIGKKLKIAIKKERVKI